MPGLACHFRSSGGLRWRGDPGDTANAEILGGQFEVHPGRWFQGIEGGSPAGAEVGGDLLAVGLHGAVSPRTGGREDGADGIGSRHETADRRIRAIANGMRRLCAGCPWPRGKRNQSGCLLRPTVAAVRNPFSGSAIGLNTAPCAPILAQCPGPRAACFRDAPGERIVTITPSLKNAHPDDSMQTNIGGRASIAGRPDVAQATPSCVEIHAGRLLRGVAGAGEFGLQPANRALGGKRDSTGPPRWALTRCGGGCAPVLCRWLKQSNERMGNPRKSRSASRSLPRP